jgi:uridine kinase
VRQNDVSATAPGGRGYVQFDELAAVVLSRPARLGRVRLVAVDGPSGAGKTVFAERLAERLNAAVVHTDDLLDGWGDQFTFWPRLEDKVLQPLRQGRAAEYQRYRWDPPGFGDEAVRVEPAGVVVMEGVSSARRVIRPELSLAVFITAPPQVRWSRVLARDGTADVAFAAYLERWRAAEDRHFAADRTAEFAEIGVDGAADGSGEGYEQLWQRPPG